MSNTPVNPYPEPTGPKRLTRSREDKMIAGVCGGLARYANVDVTVVRVLMVVALILGFPITGVLYLVVWALMPQA